MLDYILKFYDADDGQGEGAGQGGDNGDGNQPQEPENKPEQPKQEKPPTKDEILREMSKKYGVNLFDAEGLQAFKEYQESQKSELEKTQEQLEAYKQQEAEWQSKRLEYESKLKASELGIHKDNLEDALKLAEGDPNKLADVVKKYPMFKTKDGIKIGMQHTDDTPPNDNSEVEAYMKNNPIYARYYNKK